MDKFSSLVAAENVIETVIGKVMHHQYMKELEKKVTPYVVLSTTHTGLKMVEGS